MFELVEFLLLFLEIIIEVVFAFGFERRAEAYGRPLFRYSPWMYCGLAMLGGCVGWLISELVPEKILTASSFRGASLILAPLIAGFVMKWFGDWRERNGHERTVIATFWGGAAFAFGTALMRGLMVGREVLTPAIFNPTMVRVPLISTVP